MYEVRVEGGFEAGHRCGPGGEETALHHHQWDVAVRVRSRDLDHIGIVVDFRVVRSGLDGVLAQLDQRVLEEVDAFADTPPTAPAVARWIFEQMGERLTNVPAAADTTEPDGSQAFWLEAVEVEADPGTRIDYRPRG